MSARLDLSCNGCDATANVPLRRRYEVQGHGAVFVDGKSFDRCAIVTDKPEEAVPDGWVVWDPYTFMTYCPECWASIDCQDPAAHEEALRGWGPAEGAPPCPECWAGKASHADRAARGSGP